MINLLIELIKNTIIVEISKKVITSSMYIYKGVLLQDLIWTLLPGGGGTLPPVKRLGLRSLWKL